MFGKGELDEEDKQAEQAWDYCERRMEERRLGERERRGKEELERQARAKRDPNNLPIS